MAIHENLKPSDQELPLLLAGKALNGVRTLSSRPTGTIAIDNADGTSTIIGDNDSGDSGVAEQVGKTSLPGTPTGLTVASMGLTVSLMWDGTTDGVEHVSGLVAVLEDAAGVQVPMGQLHGAGSLVAPATVPGLAHVTAYTVDNAHADDGTSQPNKSESVTLDIVLSEIVDSQAIDDQIKQVNRTLDDNRQKLEDNQNAIDANQKALEENKKTLDQANTDLTAAKKELADSQSRLTQTEENVKKNEDNLKLAYGQSSEAKTTADDAKKTADQAQKDATDAKNAASGLSSDIDAAKRAASDASTAAKNASNAVAGAQKSADTALSQATDALSQASKAQKAADSASSKADSASSAASSASSKADKAQKAADNASSAASSASSKADSAQRSADSASDAAREASQRAASALANANQALARATHVTMSPSTPSSPTRGDVWFPTDSSGRATGMRQWDGASWVDVQLVAGSVLVPGSVGSTLIADGAVTTPKLEAGSVDASKIAAGSITSGKIVSGAITSDKIAANAVSADKIQANSIGSEKLTANAVHAENIAAGAVNADKLAANSVTADKLGANSVTADKIAAESITGDKIAANSISASKLTISAGNLFSNPTFAGDSAYGTTDRVDNVTLPDGSTGSTVAMKMDLTGMNPNVSDSEWIPCNRGDVFYVGVWLSYADDTPSVPQGRTLDLGLDTRGDSSESWPNNGAQGLNIDTSEIPRNDSSGDKWKYFHTYVTCTATGVTRFWIDVISNSNGFHLLVWRPTVIRAADAKLIVDGSVTAQKVAAGVVDGQLITGATFRAKADGDIEFQNPDGGTGMVIRRGQILIPNTNYETAPPDLADGQSRIVIGYKGLDLTVKRAGEDWYGIRLGDGGLNISMPDGSYISLSSKTGLTIETKYLGTARIGSSGVQLTDAHSNGISAGPNGFSIRGGNGTKLATGPKRGAVYINGREIRTV